MPIRTRFPIFRRRILSFLHVTRRGRIFLCPSLGVIDAAGRALSTIPVVADQEASAMRSVYSAAGQKPTLTIEGCRHRSLHSLITSPCATERVWNCVQATTRPSASSATSP